MNKNLISFLAATCSSRSDYVTPLACLFECVLVTLVLAANNFAPSEFETLAICNTCNLQHLQFATRAIEEYPHLHYGSEEGPTL